jgi:SAM-dependent methyltransferase
MLDADRASYDFTDQSPLLLARAADRFRSFPFVRYRRLDLDRDLLEQGFTPRQFDVVIAAHVLHATQDLRSTLNRLSELLTPGGLLIIAELTRPQRWLDLTFGLTDGWWRFEDHDVRSYPLVSIEKWLVLFRSDCGFSEAVSIPRAADAGRFLSASGALFLAQTS